jgi:Fe2+ or Zn2+ uptake regulation protein
MSFQDTLNENARLNILRSLHEGSGYQAPDSILHEVLTKYGIHFSRDQVRTNLSWLQEQGLITINMLGSTYVATLTSRGADVALGRAQVPGIKRPEPKAL